MCEVGERVCVQCSQRGATGREGRRERRRGGGGGGRSVEVVGNGFVCIRSTEASVLKVAFSQSQVLFIAQYFVEGAVTSRGVIRNSEAP